MKQMIDESVLKEIDLTLDEVEKRKALLKFRQEHGLGLKAVERNNLLEALGDPEVQQHTSSVIFDRQLLEIIRSFWQCINSPMRTNAIMSFRLDHFHNEIKIARGLGIKALCFIQEGYAPPEVVADLYFDPTTRVGIEAYINMLGELVFSDVELNQAWPNGIRRLIQASVLAHYATITCPQLEVAEELKEERGPTEDDEDSGPRGPDEPKRKRKVPFRRAHLRTLAEGFHATARQLALSITSGKFSEEDVDRIIQEGKRRTFVKEVFRPSGEEAPPIEPHHLYRKISPIKFLNAYLSLVGVGVGS